MHDGRVDHRAVAFDVHLISNETLPWLSFLRSHQGILVLFTGRLVARVGMTSVACKQAGRA